MNGRSRTEAGSMAIAVLFLILMGGGVLAGNARALPSSTEQEKMRSEVYFPKAKRDTSAMLLVKIQSLAAGENHMDGNERMALERRLACEFMDNTYAELPVSKMDVKIDFDSRRDCLFLISRFSIVRTETNMLFAIADHLGKGVALPTETRDEDAKALVSIKTHLCHTPEQLAAHEAHKGKYRMVGALLTQNSLPGFGKECGEEYRARDIYNGRLANFRASVIDRYREQIKDDHPDRTEFDAIWAEFCRRAKVGSTAVSADAGEDACIRLLHAIASRPSDADVARHMVERFISLPYARLPVSRADSMVDFDARLRCIAGIAAFDIMRSDTNVFALVFRHLTELKPLPTDGRQEDLSDARQLLLRFGLTQREIDTSKSKWTPTRGTIPMCPAASTLIDDIRKEYDTRERYNNALEAYRRKALGILSSKAKERGHVERHKPRQP